MNVPEKSAKEITEVKTRHFHFPGNFHLYIHDRVNMLVWRVIYNGNEGDILPLNNI